MSLSISICIATYKRPDGLARLLDGLNQLQFHKVQPPEIEVVVADNDANASAQTVCDQWHDTFRWSLVYGVEPRQGVTYARNHSIDLASDHADFLVFIDDDECPSPQWLDELLHTQQTFQADVVTGPVFPKFEVDEVPPWITKGGFFDPPHHQTGTLLEIAYTHNSLVRYTCLKSLDHLFDENLAFRGSEDVHLFMRLRKAGSKIVWASDAKVYETIPESRIQLKWLLDRSYYGWSCHSLLERKFSPSIKVQGTRFVKGSLLLAFGLMTVPPSLILGKDKFAKSMLYVYRGLGTLSGLTGIQGAWGGADR